MDKNKKTGNIGFTNEVQKESEGTLSTLKGILA
jgi:hypothetical protein